MPITDLVTVGETFEDLVFSGLPRLPRPGEELKTDAFLATVGGGAAITAVAARRLGLRTRLVSAMSAPAARMLVNEGVKVTNLLRRGEAPAVSVSLSTPRDRSFVTFNGVNARLEPRLLAAVRQIRGRHVHFALWPKDCARWRRVVAGIRSTGRTCSWDFGWNEPLARDPDFPRLLGALDLVFLNDDEARLYAPDVPARQLSAHWRRAAAAVVVKRGSRGATWLSPAGHRHSAARRVPVADTTGAGDAFDAGFLFGILRGHPPRTALELGHLVAGFAIQRAGGLAGLPGIADLRRTAPDAAGGARRGGR